MIESKGGKDFALRSAPLLACLNLVFFFAEFGLGIELQSAALFADSLGFMEAAALGVLSARGFGMGVSGREAFGRFAGTVLLVPTCFVFWMAAANYQSDAVASAGPLAVMGTMLLLVDVSGLLALTRRTDGPGVSTSVLCRHVAASVALVVAGALTWASDSMWPDALVGLYILFLNASAAQNILYAAQRRLRPEASDVARAAGNYPESSSVSVSCSGHMAGMSGSTSSA